MIKTGELEHFGIKGMKWGVRKDRKRSVYERRGTQDSAEYTRSRELLKKAPSELTNEELKELTSRLNLEQQYSNLTTVNKGKTFTSRVKDQMTNTAVNETSKAAIQIGAQLATLALSTYLGARYYGIGR